MFTRGKTYESKPKLNDTMYTQLGSRKKIQSVDTERKTLPYSETSPDKRAQRLTRQNFSLISLCHNKHMNTCKS